ncbi:serine hydrolase domain-containing protein [Streptomyces katsurahamanus]|uniref:Beta-lactamase family protein n=1 Tax=Streptomyces katsurahamanus TaxID=2577098 RepID=A0ABW9NXF3_9ACTN|nr:serine hydrolase domain-containing protein [Streptomyces katsurahamanus]MQS37844.1 beta-lactamase family protein [Streptomyces katsurahamanus]
MTAGRIPRTGITAVTAVAAAAVAVTAFAVPAQAESAGKGRDKGHQATQRAMDAMVEAGAVGVTAAAKDREGRWKGVSGVGDREAGTPRGADDRFRIGSVTKTFVATVLLQMEAEGKLDLDDTVERHLPGLVRGNGNDGRKITVRQLLNHTSGLYNYTSDLAFQNRNLYAPGFLTHRYDTHAPRDLVKVALAHKPDFAPGTKHFYSNTGYIVAGLIIEKISGNSYEHEVAQRVIKPLGLRATSLPKGDPKLPSPSARNYSKLSPDPGASTVHDVTAHNMSWGWAAGDAISTTGDLNRFFSALLRGKLFPAEQLTAMKQAVPAPDDQLYSAYGLGIYKVRTSCDAELWSHSGGAVGAVTEAVTTPDGRHTFTYNANSDFGVTLGIVNAEFCGDGGTPERRAPSAPHTLSAPVNRL